MYTNKLHLKISNLVNTLSKIKSHTFIQHLQTFSLKNTECTDADQPVDNFLLGSDDHVVKKENMT